MATRRKLSQSIFFFPDGIYTPPVYSVSCSRARRAFDTHTSVQSRFTQLNYNISGSGHQTNSLQQRQTHTHTHIHSGSSVRKELSVYQKRYCQARAKYTYIQVPNLRGLHAGETRKRPLAIFSFSSLVAPDIQCQLFFDYCQLIWD